MRLKLLFASFLIAALGAVSLAGTVRVLQGSAQQAKVTITAKGFEPGSINLKANVPAQITFLRTVNDTCATEVVFPGYKIKKELPLNKPVVVELTPKKGTIDFACGSGMYHGKLIAN